MCTCLSKLLKEQAAARVCKGLSSDPKRFSDLSLSFYDDTPPAERALSPRERMRRIFAYCEQYAAAFSTHAPSLLLRGATGTGKTHVSLAIAGTVAENGFSVVYQPAGRLFGLLEEEHFGRRSGNTLETVLSCDLLVIDDLGTEFETSFVAATLYTIINTRMPVSYTHLDVYKRQISYCAKPAFSSAATAVRYSSAAASSSGRESVSRIFSNGVPSSILRR